MRFSTIFSVLATSAMAFAGVVPKRAATDVQNAFTSLSGNCDPIISKFDSCQDDQCSTELVNELATTIAPCDATIKPLSCDAANDGVAGAASDFATVSLGKVPGLTNFTHAPLQKIANGLESLKTKCGSNCPNLATALPKVDSALSSCLGTATNVCSGLKPLLSSKYVLCPHPRSFADNFAGSTTRQAP